MVPFQAMTYSEALGLFRQMLTLPWSNASVSDSSFARHYSLHGLKCAILSWAAQLAMSEEDRRSHGKHKPAQQSVALYSRDDVLGSLRVQKCLVKQVAGGWKPTTPQGPKGQIPVQEPAFQLERFCKA